VIGPHWGLSLTSQHWANPGPQSSTPAELARGY
jgi:hypothetical protein